MKIPMQTGKKPDAGTSRALDLATQSIGLIAHHPRHTNGRLK